jgi:hypothetical protein
MNEGQEAFEEMAGAAILSVVTLAVSGPGATSLPLDQRQQMARRIAAKLRDAAN